MALRWERHGDDVLLARLPGGGLVLVALVNGFGDAAPKGWGWAVVGPGGEVVGSGSAEREEDAIREAERLTSPVEADR